MFASLVRRSPPLPVAALLAGLVTTSLACSDLGVDPGLPETVDAVAAAADAAPPSERSTFALFDVGLSEAQRRSLFEVLAGTTDPSRLDPAERDAIRQALTQSRARLAADFDAQAGAVQASGRPEQEKAGALAHQEAFRDFTLATVDRALAALE